MSLDIKRKKLELARVQMAKMDMEFKIEERTEEIKKLHEHVKLQEIKESELILEIKSMKEEN